MASACTCVPKFYQRLGREVIVLEFAWTAHTDGSFDAVSTDDYTFGSRTLTKIITGKTLIAAKTIPDADTPPTNLYNLIVSNSYGEDMFLSLTYGLSSTTTQTAQVPERLVTDTALSIDITSNIIDGAMGIVRLYFV
jgi:hypothetical protein